MDAKFFEDNDKAKEEGRLYKRKRFIFSEVVSFLEERPCLGLIGPRGVGKTILLKQLLADLDPHAFYLSLEGAVEDFSLYEIAKELESGNVRYLFLDEIQFYPHFDREMKRIFDSMKIKIVFTGSAALSLATSAYDLSRRVRILLIPPPSLREFVSFKKNTLPNPISFSDLPEQETVRAFYGQNFIAEAYFEDYLRGHNYPFTFDTAEPMVFFNNVLERIITNDILRTGFVVFEELRDIRNVLKFIGKSPAEGINYSSIAQNCGITRHKTEKYVSLLEKSFILNPVFPTGTNVLREPKILFSLPYRLLYKNFDDCIGALREDFFVDTLRFSKKEFFYLKSTRGEKTPDYLVDDLVIEIGGKSKGRSQFKGYKAKKKIILTHPGMLDEIRRPLFLLGMVEF